MSGVIFFFSLMEKGNSIFIIIKEMLETVFTVPLNKQSTRDSIISIQHPLQGSLYIRNKKTLRCSSKSLCRDILVFKSPCISLFRYSPPYIDFHHFLAFTTFHFVPAFQHIHSRFCQSCSNKVAINVLSLYNVKFLLSSTLSWHKKYLA